MTEQPFHWSTAVKSNSPATAHCPGGARRGVGVGGGRRHGGLGPGPVGGCGSGDCGCPALHRSGEGGGSTRLRLQRPAATSGGRQGISRGLLMETMGEEGEG